MLELKPTTFVRLTAGVPAEVDLTALFIYEDKIEAGLMYRTGDALGLLLGYYATTQLRLGYSFDFSMTNTTFKYNGGSHELKVRYDFLYKRHTQKIRSPRYF